MTNKVKHLEAKWGRKKEKVPGVWKGVVIGDQELEAAREELGGGAKEQQEVPAYGGASLTPQQKDLLRLPPGFTLYEQLQEKQTEVDMEVCMVKLRWEVRSKEGREGEPWAEDWQFNELATSRVFDESTKKMSFSKLKVTNIQQKGQFAQTS